MTPTVRGLRSHSRLTPLGLLPMRPAMMWSSQMTPHTSGSGGKAPALCCEYHMSFTSLFTGIKHRFLTPNCLGLCGTGSTQSGHGISTDLCLIPGKYLLLIGLCAFVADSYLCACAKGYSANQLLRLHFHSLGRCWT